MPSVTGYQRLMFGFYTALRRLGLDVDIRRPDAPLDGYRLIVAPSLPLLDEGLLRRLRATGAVCVFGPRTGSRTASHQIPAGLPPGPLRAEIAIKVGRVESLPPALADQLVWGNRTYPVRHWRETIESALDPEAHFADGGGAVHGERGWHYLGFWPNQASCDAPRGRASPLRVMPPTSGPK